MDFTPKGDLTWMTSCFLIILGEFPHRFKEEWTVYFRDTDYFKKLLLHLNLSYIWASWPGYTKDMERPCQE